MPLPPCCLQNTDHLPRWLPGLLGLMPVTSPAWLDVSDLLLLAWVSAHSQSVTWLWCPPCTDRLSLQPLVQNFEAEDNCDFPHDAISDPLRVKEVSGLPKFTRMLFLQLFLHMASPPGLTSLESHIFHFPSECKFLKSRILHNAISAFHAVYVC